MALVAYRYCNLPYQTWELKPDFKGPPGGVVFSITASVVIIEFIIRVRIDCIFGCCKRKPDKKNWETGIWKPWSE